MTQLNRSPVNPGRFSLDFAIHYFNLKNFIETPANQVSSLGSMVRMWSLTINPTYQFWKEENVSSYVTGGYGIYNRDLQLPSTGGVLQPFHQLISKQNTRRAICHFVSPCRPSGSG